MPTVSPAARQLLLKYLSIDPLGVGLSELGLSELGITGAGLFGVPEAISLIQRRRAAMAKSGEHIPEDTPVAGTRCMADAALPRLRPRQEEALADLVTGTGELQELQNGILVAATGFGKTLVALHAVRRLRSPLLVITPTTISRDQWVKHLTDAGVSAYTLGSSEEPIPFGGFGAVVATYCLITSEPHALTEAVRANLVKVLATSFGAVISDEVHKGPTPVFSKAYDRLVRARTLGLTATLARSDGLDEHLPRLIGGPVRHVVSHEELIRTSQAPELVVSSHSVPMHPTFCSAWALPGANRRLLAVLNPWKLAVMRLLLTTNLDKKCVVFCDWVAAMPVLAEQIRRSGAVLFGPLHGKTPAARRASILKELRASTSGVLLLSSVGEMALDDDGLSMSIEMTSTSSAAGTTQRRGRLTRAGKSEARVYTLVSENAKEVDMVAQREGVAPQPWSEKMLACVPHLSAEECADALAHARAAEEGAASAAPQARRRPAPAAKEAIRKRMRAAWGRAGASSRS